VHTRTVGIAKFGRSRRLVLWLLTVSCLAGPAAAPARGAEISVLLGSGSPDTVWSTYWGGALTISLFGIVHGEIEGGWQGGAVEGTSIYNANAKAYLGPTFGGRFVPYLGIGAGVYHQSLPIDDDQGTIGLVFAGAKLKFPMGLVLRGEYQWVSLPDAAPLLLDNRYFVGVGLSF
jgi:opacity protein-like surface antigen